MKNIKVVSATEARNRWFEILSWVNIENGEVMVKRNKRIVVRILPGEKPVLDDLDKFLEKTFARLSGKKSYFPYEDKKIREKEKN